MSEVAYIKTAKWMHIIMIIKEVFERESGFTSNLKWTLEEQKGIQHNKNYKRLFPSASDFYRKKNDSSILISKDRLARITAKMCRVNLWALVWKTLWCPLLNDQVAVLYLFRIRRFHFFIISVTQNVLEEVVGPLQKLQSLCLLLL